MMLFNPWLTRLYVLLLRVNLQGRAMLGILQPMRLSALHESCLCHDILQGHPAAEQPDGDAMVH